MRARFSCAIFGILLLPLLSPSQTPAKANTVDITNGPFSNQPIAGLRIMNEPCSYGSQYHYQINELGELRTEGKTVCGALRPGQGGQLLCHLNLELRCTGAPGFSAAVIYAVDGRGVTAGNGASVPWANAENARALFPLIQYRAEQKCEEVLKWEAIDKAHGRGASSAARAQEQESCRPVLKKYCTGFSGGPVRLASGKDISVLCAP
jgi:hypothetical protein